MQDVDLGLYGYVIGEGLSALQYHSAKGTLKVNIEEILKMF